MPFGVSFRFLGITRGTPDLILTYTGSASGTHNFTTSGTLTLTAGTYNFSWNRAGTIRGLFVAGGGGGGGGDNTVQDYRGGGGGAGGFHEASGINVSGTTNTVVIGGGGSGGGNQAGGSNGGN